MVRLIMKQWVFFLTLSWLIAWTVLQLWPSSYWMTVSRVHAFDTPYEKDVIMDVGRSINRPFVGHWSVLVRSWSGESWDIYCAAQGSSDYRPSAVLPVPLTLNWWTNGQCHTPDTGTYFIATIWSIKHAILPEKTISVESNVFRVLDLPQGDVK